MEHWAGAAFAERRSSNDVPMLQTTKAVVQGKMEVAPQHIRAHRGAPISAAGLKQRPWQAFWNPCLTHDSKRSYQEKRTRHFSKRTCAERVHCNTTKCDKWCSIRRRKINPIFQFLSKSHSPCLLQCKKRFAAFRDGMNEAIVIIHRPFGGCGGNGKGCHPPSMCAAKERGG
jgi:hypothetical protein